MKYPVYFQVGLTYVKLIGEDEAISVCLAPEKEFIHHIKTQGECEENKVYREESRQITPLPRSKYLMMIELLTNRLRLI